MLHKCGQHNRKSTYSRNVDDLPLDHRPSDDGACHCNLTTASAPLIVLPIAIALGSVVQSAFRHYLTILISYTDNSNYTMTYTFRGQ